MSPSEWRVPAGVQPRPQNYEYDLDRALSSVLALTATVPGDAYTAETLGTERAGNAVLIRDSGLVLTIGYLITEATTVWLTSNDGRVVQGHVVGFDPQSGLGLVQSLERMTVPALPIGRSALVKLGDPIVVAGAGGRRFSIAGHVAAKQEFAGYWEYLLDEAIFTTPAHPHWGGTALINRSGELVGVGSLQLQQERDNEQSESLNMIVPIDLLEPILRDMLTLGRPDRPGRPWLGTFATEVDGHVVVAGVSRRSPAERAGLQLGDLILSVAGEAVEDLAEFLRRVWSLGNAGVRVPLSIQREGNRLDVVLESTDRALLLRRPVMH